MSKTPLLLACLLATAAVATLPSASADCVTVAGTGPCFVLGGSGTGPGVVGTGGVVCYNDYCPSLGSQPYKCYVTVEGKGALHAHACIGIPILA